MDTEHLYLVRGASLPDDAVLAVCTTRPIAEQVAERARKDWHCESSPSNVRVVPIRADQYYPAGT
jgi:hypothetical protein